jgi:hypothetical protein
MHWRDANNKLGTSFWTTQVQSNAVPAGLLSLGAAAQAMSNCGLIAVQYQTTAVLTNVPTSGPYPTVFDRAVMLATITNTNSPRQLAIPGPVSSIFLPDNVTVDLSNSLVAAFAAQAQANLGDTAGNPVGPFVRGRRTQAGGSP